MSGTSVWTVIHAQSSADADPSLTRTRSRVTPSDTPVTFAVSPSGVTDNTDGSSTDHDTLSADPPLTSTPNPDRVEPTSTIRFTALDPFNVNTTDNAAGTTPLDPGEASVTGTTDPPESAVDGGKGV